ncbi:Hemerythrin [Paramagnetospirillum magnetotacticum MS-1]|uniref:Hemerythrin n=1 Tax=Paramagnetospirillum magnetotacticum MS-1 TaxID=272627 RepID=A0A0C2YX44_PARME|nr:bacteriohemerythrin [Paramagnetospirillum magnetotacticum]KIL99255.1 Hemerythrin [Paramagnetospirillum magnetotacticum MS-1]
MIVWRDAMSVGAPALDADHKRLIDLINLTEQWIGQDNWRQVATVTDELLRYVDEHFRREESVMAAIKYPEIEQHKKAHETLAQKARLLHEKFKAATQDEDLKTCSQVLIRVLTDWLVTHILKEDMKYKASIPKKAPPPPPPPPAAVEMYNGLPPKEDEEARKARWEARHKDIEYELPPNLAHLLKRLEYVVPELPPPAKSFESFERLCEAAIGRRIDKVLVFFHRHNPDLKRELPPFFLASPEFAEKFKAAVTKFIFPTIWESRNIRMLSTSYEWAEDDSDSFWEHVTKPLEDSILQGWNSGWDDLKLLETKRPDGTRVFQVKDNTKALREMLAPSSPMAYDIPKIGNREIETLRSLLDPKNDWWKRLNHAWRICHDLYEQEKDPRIFQQKAREGALRDNLLNAFAKFPPEWGDFLVLACHRVFPRVSTAFLESFVCNFGTTDAQRETHVPYTVRYLRQVKEDPDIWLRERNAEQEWQAQMKELSNYLANRTEEDEKKKR